MSDQLEREIAERDRAIAGLTQDLENLQADVLGKNRQIKKLRSQLEGDRNHSPDRRQVEVFGHWVKTMGKNPKKSKLGAGREKVINARLNEGTTVDELKKAIDGCALMPFVGPHGRQADESHGAKRHDDLELICRSEVNVERFIRYTEEDGAGVAQIRPKLPPDLEAMMALCDCGHRRGVHSYPLQPLWVPENMVGWEPCRECECMDWGWGYGVAERKAAA